MISESLQMLLAEMELSGPIRSKWPHFGRLAQQNCYHCHLHRGRPTYVAVWKVFNKKDKVIEVIYVGTHEGVHYDRLC